MKHFRRLVLVRTLLFLIGVLYFLYFAGRDPALGVRVSADFDNLSVHLREYAKMTGGFPTTEQGFAALAERPKTPPIPAEWRSLLPGIPEDPWGRLYGYRAPTTSGHETSELFSLGPDISDSADDIRRSFTF
jgi:general secretion pathway protein G